jgi:2-oxoisovalerate dehydrogenase E1 component
MEQYIDSSHDYWRSTVSLHPNVTIRLASGGYIGGGLYHSQNIEGSLAAIPGIRIVYPSFADDAAGLLRTSIRSRGLTMFMEPKTLYQDPKAATVIPEDFEVPFGVGRIRQKALIFQLLPMAIPPIFRSMQQNCYHKKGSMWK